MWGASLARTQQTQHVNSASMRWIFPWKSVHDLWIMQELRYILLATAHICFLVEDHARRCLITSLSRMLWGLRWSLIGTQFKLNFWERSGSVSATELFLLTWRRWLELPNEWLHSPDSEPFFCSHFVWHLHYSSPKSNWTDTIPVGSGSIRD